MKWIILAIVTSLVLLFAWWIQPEVEPYTPFKVPLKEAPQIIEYSSDMKG